jgi:leucyl aminopeptidase (aminopeptidase T)
MAAVKKGRAARKKTSRRVPSRIARAARTAIADVLRVRKGERVVIVTNPLDDVLTISAALYDAALDRGADAVVIVQPRRTSLDMASDAVIHALRSEPQVVISISADKLGKDRFGMEKPYRFGRRRGSWTHIFNALMGSGRARSFWSPSVTLDMFARTVPVDYAQMRRQAAKLKRALDRADRVHIAAPGGTDIEIGLRGRAARADDGAFWRPGSGGNLPAGETYISPANYDAEGVLVFDGSVAVADGGGAFVPRSPVTVEVAGGLVTAVRGGAGAKRFERSLRLGEAAARKMRGRTGWTQRRIAAYARNARHLGELGIGLNPAARVTGNMLEDEKILGTCHIAVGANYDEDAQAFTHLDCIVKSPTITTISRTGRRTTLMNKGKIR